MCHQKPERSFKFRGKQFPICARCTGILIGLFLGIFVAIMFGTLRWWVILLFPLPGAIDGIIQQKTPYESNNILRLLTGVLMGIGIIYFFIYWHVSAEYLAKKVLGKN